MRGPRETSLVNAAWGACPQVPVVVAHVRSRRYGGRDVTLAADVAEDGQNPAVVAIRGRQTEFREDVRHVLLHDSGGDDKSRCDPALDRPSAISESTSRSRGVSDATPAPFL